MTGDSKTAAERHAADQLEAEDRARRVSEMLQQIRAGVRQRQAERAANLSARQVNERQSDQWSPIADRFADLQARAVVVEKPFISHMPVLGPLIAFVRRTWNSVATRWFVLPMVQQQNEFNQLVVDALRRSLTASAQLGSRLEDVDARMQEADARLGEAQAKMDETKRYLDARVREAEQHLEQLDLRLISSDRDVTDLARKVAEREYRVRQWNAEAAQERVELVDRLDQLQNMLAALSDVTG